MYIILRRRRRSDTPESASAGIGIHRPIPGENRKKRLGRTGCIILYYYLYSRAALPTTRHHQNDDDDDDDDGPPSTERDELISTTDGEVRSQSTRSQMLRGPATAARLLSHDAAYVRFEDACARGDRYCEYVHSIN